jgi:hypothetical protein
MWFALGSMIVAIGAANGCHHRAVAGASVPAASKDSLTGVVSVNGTSFEQHLTLRSGNAVRDLAATPGDSAALSRIGGAEVVVYGTEGRRFQLSTFIVKSVSAVAVVDGVLLREGARYALLTRNGMRALGNPPTAFDSLVGARIWIGGPLETGPNSYGVIVPPIR